MADNASIIATPWIDQRAENLSFTVGRFCLQFQGDPFQGFGAHFHDLFARGYRAGEGDFLYVWMAHDPRPKFIVASEDLQHPGRENGIADFDRFEGCIWCVRPKSFVNCP